MTMCRVLFAGTWGLLMLGTSPSICRATFGEEARDLQTEDSSVGAATALGVAEVLRQLERESNPGRMHSLARAASVVGRDRARTWLLSRIQQQGTSAEPDAAELARIARCGLHLLEAEDAPRIRSLLSRQVKMTGTTRSRLLALCTGDQSPETVGLSLAAMDGPSADVSWAGLLQLMSSDPELAWIHGRAAYDGLRRDGRLAAPHWSVFAAVRNVVGYQREVSQCESWKGGDNYRRVVDKCRSGGLAGKELVSQFLEGGLRLGTDSPYEGIAALQYAVGTDRAAVVAQLVTAAVLWQSRETPPPECVNAIWACGYFPELSDLEAAVLSPIMDPKAPSGVVVAACTAMSLRGLKRPGVGHEPMIGLLRRTRDRDGAVQRSAFSALLATGTPGNAAQLRSWLGLEGSSDVDEATIALESLSFGMTLRPRWQ